jgi:hypothetical protein
MRPLQNQRPNRSKAIRGRTISSLGIKIKIVARNPSGGVKRKGQIVGQLLCLGQNSIDSSGIRCVMG